MLQGQIAMAAADNQHFPAIFVKHTRFDAPGLGLVITAIFITILLLLSASPSLIHQINLITLIATLASLLPYFYTTMASIIILKRAGAWSKGPPNTLLLPLSAPFIQPGHFWV